MTPSAQKCRSCGSSLSVMMADLGIQPPANSYLPLTGQVKESKYPLRVAVCGSCMLAQVDHDVPPEELFANYAYFSSYSSSWLEHVRKYTDTAQKRFALGPNSLVIELASNDGYLLKNFVTAGVPSLGIDPSDTVAKAAREVGVETLVEFFGEATARKVAGDRGQADLIIGINVLAHVPALNDFVRGISILLKKGGTANLEFPHLLKLIEHGEFDTIYHEHFSYFSLIALKTVFARHGLRVYDIDEVPTHGGSLRLYVCHADDGKEESLAVAKVLKDEVAAGLDKNGVYEDFARKVEVIRKHFLAFLDAAENEGKRVVAYGAAAKGNTFLNFCDVDVSRIGLVADRNDHKQKKRLPGSHIPIVSPEELMAAKPDYVVILPWNVKDEIMKQLKDIRDWGGRFVTAVPSLTIHP